MRNRVTIALLIITAVVLASGCATRGWVRETMTRERADVDGHMAEAGRQIEAQGQRLDAEAVRLRALGAQVDTLDQRVAALATAHRRDLVDRLDVRFGFDRAELDDAAETALLGLIERLRSDDRLSVELEGYTDSLGARDYNVQLSQRRVEAVRRYLVRKGIELPRIHAIGLGPLEERGLATRERRRVTVKVLVPAEAPPPRTAAGS